MKNIAQAVKPELFSVAGLNVFAVLDGASGPNLPAGLQQLRAEPACLYRGELEPELAAVAPYLVQLEPETRLTEYVLTQGWGNHWGIFARSRADLRTLRRHFRTFLTVYDPDGKPMLFRFYDPRVLRLYLPTCNAQELAVVFGPVETYLLEDVDPDNLLRCHFVAGGLQQKQVPLVQALQTVPSM